MLDTDVLVAAFRSDQGASRKLVDAALRQSYALLLSVPLVLEYEAVLTRPEQLEASGLTSAETLMVLDTLVATAEPVRFSFRWRPLSPDPQDDMVIETAANGGARYLVTFNRHDFEQAAGLFELDILSPREAVHRLGLR